MPKCWGMGAAWRKAYRKKRKWFQMDVFPYILW